MSGLKRISQFRSGCQNVWSCHGDFEMKLRCMRNDDRVRDGVEYQVSDAIQLNASIMVLCSHLTSTQPSASYQPIASFIYVFVTVQ